MTIGAKASTSYRKLRLGVQVVDARAEVSYVLPVALIQYVALKVSASLDPVGRNPFILDGFAVVDSVSIEALKNFFDQASVSDEIRSLVGKNLADSVNMSDSVSLLLTFIREFADSVGTSDSQVIDFAKNLGDPVVPTDTLSFFTEKLISDGVAINDMADIDDGFTFQFEAYFTNLAFVNDSLIRVDTFKNFFDTASVEDTGSLICQDYCDITYFAEDYVGQSRTFT
jgi:hypothetical protein